jgi:phage replication O-like protein O
MATIDKPNYTQVPNSLLGDIERGNKVSPGLMATLEGSQLKVLLAIYRMTFGYHQNTRRASITMIEELTGLSRQGVINAANKLEELNLISRGTDGGVTLWQAIVNSFDCNYDKLQSNEYTPLVNSVDQLVNSVDSHLRKKPIKEIIKEEKEPAARHSDFAKVCQSYQMEIGGLSQTISDMINDDLAVSPADWIIQAMQRAAEQNKRSYAYVRGILKNWTANGGPQNDKPKHKGANNGHSGSEQRITSPAGTGAITEARASKLARLTT